MDMMLDWNETVETVRFVGIDAFLQMLKDEYPHMDFYKISTSWIEDSTFCCKVKGTKGDLIIKWR